MNGQPLPPVYGAPLRLRVENQLGYKMIKWIERIEFISSEKLVGEGEGARMRMRDTSIASEHLMRRRRIQPPLDKERRKLDTRAVKNHGRRAVW